MIGERFGRLVVLAHADARRSGHKMRARAVVRCDCGTEKEIWSESLKYAKTVSCGCLQREVVADRERTHGMATTPLYKVWSSIKRRCRVPDDPHYAEYGGRGITVCDEWADDFAAFARAVGKRPSVRHSLDRVDNDRGYEPGNVRWATHTQQMRNTRHNHLVFFNGRDIPISQAIEESRTSVNNRTVYRRVNKGWQIERALS